MWPWSQAGSEQEGMASEAGAASRGGCLSPLGMSFCASSGRSPVWTALGLPVVCGWPSACLRVSADHALVKAQGDAPLSRPCPKAQGRRPPLLPLPQGSGEMPPSPAPTPLDLSLSPSCGRVTSHLTLVPPLHLPALMCCDALRCLRGS